MVFPTHAQSARMNGPPGIPVLGWLWLLFVPGGAVDFVAHEGAFGGGDAFVGVGYAAGEGEVLVVDK